MSATSRVVDAATAAAAAPAAPGSTGGTTAATGGTSPAAVAAAGRRSIAGQWVERDGVHPEVGSET